jgi:hypothetical protein
VAAIEIPELIPGDINMDYVKQVSGMLRAFRINQKNHHKLRFVDFILASSIPLIINISKTLPWIYGDLILKDEEIETLASMCAENEVPQVR